MIPRMNASGRLVVALDRSSRDEILQLAQRLSGAAGVLKLGLQAFVANGPSLVRELAGRGERVFLDLKLHDIPNTVAKAVGEAAQLGVHMVTIHASGGPRMMEAAVKAAEGSDLLLLGVTVLTSLDDAQMRAVGYRDGASISADRLAKLAADAGVGGVVASPLEIAMIRRRCGAGLKIVTPGIRAAGEARGDQVRTMAPGEAIRAGADYIVVGRPITEASDPRAAAEKIVEAMAG